MHMRRRILVSVGFAVIGAAIAVLVGYPFVHHVVTERDGLTRQIAGLENGFNDEQSRAAALQHKLDARNQEIAAANLRQQRNEVWRASEEQAAKQTAARLGKLNDELDAAQGSGKQVQEANAKLQRRLNELQAQSTEQRKQLTQAHEQQQKLETQLAGQQQTAADLQQRLAKAQQAARQAQQTGSQLQQRLDEQQTQLAANQKQSAERAAVLAQAQEQQQKLEAQLVGGRKQLADRNHALTQAQEQQQKLEAQLAAGKKQLAESDTALTRAHERQQKLGAQLVADQKTGQQRTARIAELTDALRQARDQQQALQTKMESADVAQQAAEVRVADLEKKLESMQHPGASAVSAVLAPATGGNESLQRRLAELQAQLSRYTAQRPAAEHPAAHDADGLTAARQRAARLTAAYKEQLENATKLKHVDAGTLNQLAAARNALEKAQAEIARIEGARGIYTVQGGDSLSLIAAFFYHNGNRWPQIFKSNAFLVSNPDLIFPGMVLVVPE